jgi:phenylacetate-CoA ligase
MMYEPDIEKMAWSEQRSIDAPLYREQIAYLFAKSRFYRKKLGSAGFQTPDSVGELDAIARLPFTEKDELRASRSDADPVGTHLAAPQEEIVRIFSTSGSTGIPSYLPLTAQDLENWIRTSSRSYMAPGMEPGQGVLSTYNAGPFVAGAALDALNRLGVTHIPIGTGNTERLLAAIHLLKPQVLLCTPSYALHLIETAETRGMNLRASSIERIMVAGEPGGGEPAMRAKLEEGWGAQVTEAMGIGDISVSLWGECEHQHGMHFSGRGFVHFELIDPESGDSVPIVDGARGELVLTHLRHRGAPLLRFRSRDHVVIWTEPCPCGRTSPRMRCIGRTDDMLIVRGVNVFPSAIREVVNRFAPAVSGVISIRPGLKGVKQAPPLRVVVELAEGLAAPSGLASEIERDIRATLICTTKVEFVPYGGLPRSDYKSKLLDFSEAKEEASDGG